MQKIDIDNDLREKLKNFFKTIEVTYRSMNGYCSFNDTDLLVNCLIHQMQTGKNVLEEYINLKDKMDKYIDFDKFINVNIKYDHWHYEYGWDRVKVESIREIDELLSYDGYWTIPETVKEKLELTKKLMEDTNENPNDRARREEERKATIDKYYDYVFIEYMAEVEQAKKDIETLQLLPMKQVPSKIDFYPLILMVFDDTRNIVNMLKVDRKLEGRLERLNEKYPSYTYGYLPMDERVIEHVFAELCVYYNPKDLSNSTFSYRQSPYKSLNIIKERFKGELGIDLRVIKKVCEMYKIDIHYLNNNNVVVDRNKINQALSDYTGRDFTKHPDN